MKTLAEFANNQSWLEALRFFAFRFIVDGVSPNEKVIVTHYRLGDSRYSTEPQAVIVESDKRFKPYKGMTRANLVELPEGMTLGKLSNYTLAHDVSVPQQSDWVSRFITEERYRSTQVTTGGPVIELLERLEEAYHQSILIQRKAS